MSKNQNETTEFGLRIADCGMQNTNSRDLTDRRCTTKSRFNPSSAFTLVELLVVISIIAVLAGLITGAVFNALETAKKAAITLEIQQLESAIEDFKNEYGAYPPNVFIHNSLSSNPEKTTNAQVLLRFMRKAYPRSTEFNIDFSSAEPKRGTPANDNAFPIATIGLSPAEALVFWLQGFSNDIARPLSGTDLEATQIEYTNPVSGDVETPNTVVTIETHQPRYDFDRGRLRMSRNSDGDRRFMSMNRANGDRIQIQLYEYVAPNSEEPYVYFDTSRETPEQVVNNWETTEFFYSSPRSGGTIFPLKQLRADVPTTGTVTLDFVEYVNARKFQILHCGLDDAWGDFSISAAGSKGQLDVDDDTYIPLLLFPTGPFLGDIADTLGIGTGTLEDAQE